VKDTDRVQLLDNEEQLMAETSDYFRRGGSVLETPSSNGDLLLVILF
jgi:hypothetical protein